MQKSPMPTAAHPDVNQARILRSTRMQRAFTLADRLYEGRTLPLSRELSLSQHVRQVLATFIDFCPDEDALIACILQHSLVSPTFSANALKLQFGEHVAEIVSRIHLLSYLNTNDWRKSVDDLKVMLVSVSDDVRVVLLKLCIHCHLVEHPELLTAAYHQRASRETLQVYAPVAARLGIYALKYRLEDAAFPVCYSTDAELIQRQLQLFYDEHGLFLPDVISKLQSFFGQEGMTCTVAAREKHPYSIFQKMKRKSVTSIDKIHDLIALRAIVQSVPDCYQVLGLLHKLGTPLSHRFKDYISFPKPNGYQSLHTCVFGLPGSPKDVAIEVQIRTQEMHREAEYGIAAHWMYKETGAIQKGLKSLQLADVLAKQQVIDGEDGPSKSSLKLVDHIYVLTPRGDIIELPKDATPLDFAFALHTDLGLKFKSARVNGTVVPLSYKLENGDRVEVLMHRNPRPALQWLERLRTPSARSKLKAYFFSHNRDEFIDRGRIALNGDLKSRRLPLLDNDLTQLKTFDGNVLSTREREDLLAKIGMGAVRVSSIVRHLPLPVVASSRTAISAAAPRRRKQLIEVESGGVPMPVRFAKCCSVDKADSRKIPIVGFVTRSGEVSVHREGCGMIRGANSARKVKVRWGKDA